MEMAVGLHGILCPRCGSDYSRVTDSRPDRHNAIRRRRACQRCDHRFTTYERVTVGIPTVHTLAARLNAIVAAINELQIVLGVIIEEAKRTEP